MMRLTLLLTAVFWSFGSGAAGDDPSTPNLQQAMQDAAGVALVNVTSLKEIDQRIGDGSLHVVVETRIIESSGMTVPELIIIKEMGGFGTPRGTSQPSPGIYPLKPDSLTPGKDYWILYSSPLDDKYVQEVAAFWDADVEDVASVLAKAVREDRYLWQPQYSSKTGLTYGHLLEPEQNRWRIRVSRQDEVLWEKMIEGQPPGGSWRRPSLDIFANLGSLRGEGEAPMDTYVLSFRNERHLQADEECGIEAGPYSVSYVFDTLAGRLITEGVYEGVALRCQRSYDIATGRMIVLDLFTLQTGGISVGADKDTWMRRESRRFDKNTGKPTETKFFREGQTEVDGLPAGTGWLPIDTAQR